MRQQIALIGLREAANDENRFRNPAESTALHWAGEVEMGLVSMCLVEALRIAVCLFLLMKDWSRRLDGLSRQRHSALGPLLAKLHRQHNLLPALGVGD